PLVWLIAPATKARDAAIPCTVLRGPEAESQSEPEPGIGPALDRSRLVTLPVIALALAYLVSSLRTGIAGISLGTINLALLVLGMLLHGSPRRLLAAVNRAVPSTAGVVLQFPLYAG